MTVGVYNSNRGHATASTSHVHPLARTLPGPVEGREWAQQRREKLLEAPKVARAKPDSVGFLLGFFWNKRNWVVGLEYFFLFNA